MFFIRSHPEHTKHVHCTHTQTYLLARCSVDYVLYCAIQTTTQLTSHSFLCILQPERYVIRFDFHSSAKANALHPPAGHLCMWRGAYIFRCQFVNRVFGRVAGIGTTTKCIFVVNKHSTHTHTAHILCSFRPTSSLVVVFHSNACVCCVFVFVFLDGAQF